MVLVNPISLTATPITQVSLKCEISHIGKTVCASYMVQYNLYFSSLFCSETHLLQILHPLLTVSSNYLQYLFTHDFPSTPFKELSLTFALHHHYIPKP